jgi:polysaccharide deacetylase 2 family uncharacterized protein YibQ
MAKRAKRGRRARSAKGARAAITAPVVRAKRRLLAGLDAVLSFRWAHSSIFIIGVALGLGIGLSLGLGIAWLDGRRQAHSERAPKPAVVAEAPPLVQEAPKPVAPVPAPAPPPALPPLTSEPAQIPPAPGPATTPVQPVAPNYSEQTENVPDEVPPDAAPAPSADAPPAVPPTVPPAAAPVPSGPEPAWLKNAVASIDPGDRPAIAIVLDDVGAAPADVAGAIALPPPVTLSIMTYAPNAPKVAAAAHQAGHEIMVHVPMEPVNRDADPGPNALLTGLSPEEIQRRLDWGLAQFGGYVGINNHMGSKFTQNAAGMRVVLQALKARGLLFLDSRTIAGSVGDKLAAEIGVTHVQRDVFLDDVIDEGDIMKELAKTEAIAAKHGFAIAIGHPHPDTVAALRRWIPAAKARGFVLVPLTTIAKKQAGVTG